MDIQFSSIGIIQTPWTSLEGMPIQPSGAMGTRGMIELKPAYAEGLDDLDGFSHIYLLYLFHGSCGHQMKVTPFLDQTERGLFSTRAPTRPNPIGLSIVKLIARTENRLFVEDVDMLDQTPLIDIKPWVPGFDIREGARSGWLEENQNKADTMKSDNRLIEKCEED